MISLTGESAPNELLTNRCGGTVRPIGDHFYTTLAEERDNAVANSGYTFEGVAGDVLAAPDVGTTPLFRLFNPGNGDHFYTISEAERDNAVATFGYTSEGTECSAFQSGSSQGNPLFRLLNPGNGDHFYTTSAAERDNAVATFGYTSEGTACNVLPAERPSRTPLFRLLNPGNGDHFYTTSFDERDSAVATFGYNPEGVACDIFTAPEAGTTPLFRLLNPGNGDHFYTTSAAERDNAVATFGYTSEGVAGHVFDATADGRQPLFRLRSLVTGDHFYTTSVAERHSAMISFQYVPEGVACWVPAAVGVGRTPLFRLNKRHGARVRLRLKVLQAPTVFTINQMLAGMRQVYDTVGIRVEVGSREDLNLPALLDVDVGTCTMGSTTAEQNQLFGNRNGVEANDVAIYFVRSTVPAFNGCAAFPAGQPGAIVASIASQWTLGHEIGHDLGLSHVNDNDRLMTGNGTFNITNPPPDLIASEGSTMDTSPLTVDI